MKIRLRYIGCLVLLIQTVTTTAQKFNRINLMLIVNDKLIVTNAVGLKLLIASKDSTCDLDVRYQPGNLQLDSLDLQQLNKAKSATLKFDYYSYSNHRMMIANLKVDFPPILLKQPYIIFRFYDFNDKRFKRLYNKTLPKNFYKLSTDGNFAVNIEYPGSGWFQENR